MTMIDSHAHRVISDFYETQRLEKANLDHINKRSSELKSSQRLAVSFAVTVVMAVILMSFWEYMR